MTHIHNIQKKVEMTNPRGCKCPFAPPLATCLHSDNTLSMLKWMLWWTMGRRRKSLWQAVLQRIYVHSLFCFPCFLVPALKQTMLGWNEFKLVVIPTWTASCGRWCWLWSLWLWSKKKRLKSSIISPGQKLSI